MPLHPYTKSWAELTHEVRDPQTGLWLGELDVVAEILVYGDGWEAGEVFVDDADAPAPARPCCVYPRPNQRRPPAWLAQQIKGALRQPAHQRNVQAALEDAANETPDWPYERFRDEQLRKEMG